MGQSDFYQDVIFSLRKDLAERLDLFYFKYFPDLAHIEKINDEIRQKQGIDKILHFKSGESKNIEEKIRDKDYGDILFEEYSNYETKSLGWMLKDQATDYLIYVILPKNRLYVFDYPKLKTLFLGNYNNWLLKYDRKMGKTLQNGKLLYETSNIPVPLTLVKDCIYKSFDLVSTRKY